MKKVVLDTNIIIAVIFWRGNSRDVYNLIREGKIVLLTSIQIETELIRVLAYPKFGLVPVEILPIINNIRSHANFIKVESIINVVKEDPTDNIFLECAQDGKADYIISGDHHLLNMSDYKGIPILRPKEFLIKEGFLQQNKSV